MAKLLVSVRDAAEAIEAVAGGASVIDIKEPSRGPLGRADLGVWTAVLAAVPAGIPVSAALGDISDAGLGRLEIPPDPCRRLGFVKLGLAGATRLGDWQGRWADLVGRLGPGPAWVGVVYLDPEAAAAPAPAEVADAAERLGCAGLLFDTWDKSRPAPESGWAEVLEAWRRVPGRFAAVAGSLDAAKIGRLRQDGIEPDLFGVRGAACAGGLRTGRVERRRVAELAQAAAIRPEASSDPRIAREADRPLAMQSARPVPVR